MQENIYKRLAQAEAMAAAQKAETMEVLQAAYKRACEELNEEDAAAFARKIRDKLLNETDSRVALDRFNISVPSGTSFTAWLSFLKSLGEIITGAWAIYRQALRDLPEQEGFPFNVTFPTPPEVENDGTEGE
nr:MAG TPA: tail assembly chaperone protein [Caudoviricetes sp.]